MSIYNHSDDPSHDLKIYEQEQERLDKREERLEQLTKEAEEMYRTEELGELLRWCVEEETGVFIKDIAIALAIKDFYSAGAFLNELVETCAPELAREYAVKVLENEIHL